MSGTYIRGDLYPGDLYPGDLYAGAHIRWLISGGLISKG